MADDRDIHFNKRPEKTYVSKSVGLEGQERYRLRIASKVIDTAETHLFARDLGSVDKIPCPQADRHDLYEAQIA